MPPAGGFRHVEHRQVGQRVAIGVSYRLQRRHARRSRPLPLHLSCAASSSQRTRSAMWRRAATMPAGHHAVPVPTKKPEPRNRPSLVDNADHAGAEQGDQRVPVPVRPAGGTGLGLPAPFQRDLQRRASRHPRRSGRSASRSSPPARFPVPPSSSTASPSQARSGPPARCPPSVPDTPIEVEDVPPADLLRAALPAVLIVQVRSPESPDTRQVMPGLTRGGGPGGRSPSGAPPTRGCRSAWWPGRRGRGSPARCAGPRRPPAGGSPRCA